MTFSKPFFGCVFVTTLLLSGCKSAGNPSNPFAMDRQTVPPPATFSYQAAYLGQTPGTYNPQQPATVYPSATTPLQAQPTGGATSYPPSTSTGAGNYGSVSAPPASVFGVQPNATPPPSVYAAPASPAAAKWQASPSGTTGTSMTPPVPDTPVAATSTPQTLFQYMDSKVNTVAKTDDAGQVLMATPEAQVFSSSQALTRISEAAPAPGPPPASTQPVSQPAAETQVLYQAW